METHAGVGRFARRIMLFWLPIVMVIGAIEGWFWYTGETWSMERVAAYQEEHVDARWLRGHLDQSFFHYKLLRMSHRLPDIVALGSSRVMEIRADMFGADSSAFYNAGGAIQNLADLHAFEAALPSAETPALIILGIDMWWLNPNWYDRSPIDHSQPDAALNWKAHLAGARRFVQSPGRFRAGADARAAGPVDRQSVGLQARAYSNGIRYDGSFDYGALADESSADPFVERATPAILRRVETGHRVFSFADGLSPARVDTLLSVIARFEAKGATVVVFLPPVWSQAANALAQNPRQRGIWHEYRTVLPAALRARGIRVIDGTTPSALGLDDRTMYDGFHGGKHFMAVVVERVME